MFLLALIASFSTVTGASSCPQLSGEYQFDPPTTLRRLVVTQQGCESVTITFVANRYTATLLTDGRPYEKEWDQKNNSKSHLPITDKTFSFDTANYVDDRLVWRIHDGAQEKCKGTYNFTSFDCKLFEHSLGYNTQLKAITWTQIGYWRSYDGRYGNDEFILQKVR